MKLHQVLMAILMFKSLDLVILYATTARTDHFVGLLFVMAISWIIVWSAIWIVVDLMDQSGWKIFDFHSGGQNDG